LLLFYCNFRCTNTPQYFVVHTFRFLFHVSIIICLSEKNICYYCDLMGYGIMQSGRQSSTFGNNTLLPHLGLNKAKCFNTRTLNLTRGTSDKCTTIFIMYPDAYYLIIDDNRISIKCFYKVYFLIYLLETSLPNFYICFSE
jgi:hypothetical protein